MTNKIDFRSSQTNKEKPSLIVSSTRRRRDIKMLLCLSVPVWKKLIWYVTTMDHAFLNFRPEIPFSNSVRKTKIVLD